jgi:hypothetical protein
MICFSLEKFGKTYNCKTPFSIDEVIKLSYGANGGHGYGNQRHSGANTGRHLGKRKDVSFNLNREDWQSQLKARWDFKSNPVQVHLEHEGEEYSESGPEFFSKEEADVEAAKLQAMGIDVLVEKMEDIDNAYRKDYPLPKGVTYVGPSDIDPDKYVVGKRVRYFVAKKKMPFYG